MYVVLYKMLSSHGKALSLDITELSSVAVVRKLLSGTTQGTASIKLRTSFWRLCSGSDHLHANPGCTEDLCNLGQVTSPF